MIGDVLDYCYHRRVLVSSLLFWCLDAKCGESVGICSVLSVFFSLHLISSLELVCFGLCLSRVFETIWCETYELSYIYLSMSSTLCYNCL